MKTVRADQTDERVIEALLGRVLRAGVGVAAATVLSGGIAYLARAGSRRADYAVFHGEPRELERVGGIAAGAWHLHPLAIAQLGVLFLIATPVARVAISVVTFSVERDWLYVAVTVIVLAILLYSLVGGA